MTGCGIYSLVDLLFIDFDWLVLVMGLVQLSMIIIGFDGAIIASVFILFIEFMSRLFIISFIQSGHFIFGLY